MRKSSKGRGDGTWSALQLAFQLGYLITIPLVIFTLLGRVLDRKIGTSPLFLISGVLISLIISGVAVSLKAKQVMSAAIDDENVTPSEKQVDARERDSG
ncbi:MAG: AtpZ/AtpI family protein [Candidatus Uhrbacteria bacterium]